MLHLSPNGVEMVAKKAKAPESAAAPADTKKAIGWKKKPVGETATAAASPEPEFDPSRIAGIVNGKTGAQLSGDATNAPFEADAAELAAQQGRPTEQQGESEAAPAAAPQPAAAAKAPRRAAPKPPAPVVEETEKRGRGAPKKAQVEAKFADGIVDSNTSKELIGICETVERMMEEKADIGMQITEKLGWAKGQGYNPKMIKTMIVLRAQDPEKRRLLQAELETYANAMGIDL